MNTIVFGIGDEVLIFIVVISLFFVPICVFGILRTDWRSLLLPMRNLYQRLFSLGPHADIGNRMENVESVRTYNPERCPICLNNHQLAVETNCGHLYCGSCLRTYIYVEGIMMPISCPMCRQSVTMLFTCFTPHELESSPNSTIGGEVELFHSMVENYNRRFSGAPRSLMEMVRDMPILLRHMWNEFFTVDGLMVMFRVRIILCFLAAVMYLFSPLDIIPEAVFGVIGFLDDIFVMFVLAVYVSIIYRRLVSSRGQRDD